MSIVAENSRCRAVFSKGIALATVIGYDADVQATETLFTSLLVQAQVALRAATAAAAPGSPERTRTFRSSFLLAYAYRVGERLEAINAHVAAEAEAETGRSVLPVLAARSSIVDARVSELFPRLGTMRSRATVDPEGWASGRMAADRARLNAGDIARSTPALPGRARRRASCSARRRHRHRAAARAALFVPRRRVVEGDPELVRERRQPGERVAELVHLLGAGALARRLRELAHLLGEPGHRRRDAPGAVPRAVRRFHPALELAELGHRTIVLGSPGTVGYSRSEDVVVKAWRVHQYGAPREVLQLDDVDAPEPGAGELKIRVTSVTLNFNDLDGIHGRYKTVPRPVPYIPGMEVLGIVEDVRRRRRVRGSAGASSRSRRARSAATPSTSSRP